VSWYLQGKYLIMPMINVNMYSFLYNKQALLYSYFGGKKKHNTECDVKTAFIPQSTHGILNVSTKVQNRL